ncbi:MAG: pyruvate dehydrogenase (acetyl-transferring), homodimeric type [Buchnera aphidicola (Periphyllus lyropictus)]|uniref:pyruvate dehydrogenase (acetyl-transferring), homodimeric type n=1 Tax=Buchnera aphidicola TaxID=9 RepID=UPI001ED73B8F|nr:pyruvate dehydrogenase (acetyl-transferring), homodimeric type [Buchnera aphidicola]NIH16652.1 pyruvate dehydrogenase (acetyl-transferring), homodimeric type [Buchnera aphidicola (Periphyllus lyropictus)]USS94562.1 pyruvate dehydrogenase (acetyl-transferring), homodimeric type [Buchnera aphidicola (Periphyllus lyropictus)]
MSKNNYTDVDIDPIETKDWLDSIESVIQQDGNKRGIFLINKILKKYKKIGSLFFNKKLITNYINTIPKKEEYFYPGNIKLEKKIASAVRWNAIMMVLRASKKKLDLGGHLSSFQSSSLIYEICFNHFFKANNSSILGDIIYFQGHISPGIYSRAFLEGRLSEQQINNFRQEIYEKGLPSYPHPKLMPNFWQFPTVSMGLSSICSIYQAKFLKYLHNRELKNTNHRKIYVFLGDGEMDEPESKGAVNIAAREKLDNLIFVINCNLQRLDGPVMGNGKIINELESFFRGSGWETIKVIWGNKWDKLLKEDFSGKLIKLMNETLDGDYQTFTSKDGAYIRKNFFGKYPETLKLVKNMTDDEIFNLNKGGHDFNKIYSAFRRAHTIKNKPVVIFFHTIKGYGMGKNVVGKNIAHQVKNISMEDIKYIKDKLKISISNKDLNNLPYVYFLKNSPEYNYIHNQRKKLGGYVPERRKNFSENLSIPELKDFSSLLIEQKKNISTTIAFVRILYILLNNKNLNKRIVPIIADEARTFGMEGLFRKVGIYNTYGQNYIPQDKDLLSYYKEEKNGQILQEGINELGAASSWLAAATSYSTNDFPMIPFYIYYSIFGFQRIGDLLWAAGDQQARGFLIGGTSGRTTLNGEGLQHEDGHSHIFSSTIPNCVSYDPAYSYELAVIIQNGLKRMYGKKQENIYYYITVTNENYYMPKLVKNSEEGICKGIYKLENFPGKIANVQLLGSGAILKIVRKAANILFEKYKIGSNVYSVTSFTELAREGQDCDRWNMLNPSKNPKIPYVSSIMNSDPVVASTDYMKLYAEQLRKYIPSEFYSVLGTDGYGRSDSRENLRGYFEINEYYIVISALGNLAKCGKIDVKLVLDAIKEFNIDINKINPRLV